MSHAIFDLHLEMPPVSLIRVRCKGTAHWIARCEMCGHRGTPRPLVSTALRGVYDHGRSHAAAMVRLAGRKDVA